MRSPGRNTGTNSGKSSKRYPRRNSRVNSTTTFQEYPIEILPGKEVQQIYKKKEESVFLGLGKRTDGIQKKKYSGNPIKEIPKIRSRKVLGMLGVIPGKSLWHFIENLLKQLREGLWEQCQENFWKKSWKEFVQKPSKKLLQKFWEKPRETSRENHRKKT